MPTKEKATHPGTEVPPDDAASGTSPEGGADERTEGTADSAAGPGAAGAAEKTRTSLFRTAKEIAASTPADTPWIAWPLVVRGAATALEGKIKIAGKSTLAADMALSILDGKPFLGKPTKQSPIVVLTEQPDISFREILRRAKLLDREDLHVLSYRLVGGRPWPEIAGMAINKAEDVGAKLTIVDTLAPFAGLTGDAENRAGDAEAAVRAITDLAAERDIGTLLVRHERKSGGNVGEAGRGSSAFGGAVDHIVSLRRLENAPRQTMRLLQLLGRFETPNDLVIELTESGYVLLGTVEEVRERELADAILKSLPTNSADALTVEQLADETGIGRTLVRDTLTSLEQSGVVDHLGHGRRGDPFRYFRRLTQTGSPPGDSAAAGGSPGAAETTSERCDGHTEQDDTATSEQKAEVRRFVAEVLHLWLSELRTPPKVHQAEAFLRETCGMPGDDGRDVIEQFLGELWEIIHAFDEEEKPATFLVALPKE
jgi:hypothetical protein